MPSCLGALRPLSVPGLFDIVDCLAHTFLNLDPWPFSFDSANYFTLLFMLVEDGETPLGSAMMSTHAFRKTGSTDLQIMALQAICDTIFYVRPCFTTNVAANCLAVIHDCGRAKIVLNWPDIFRNSSSLPG